LTQDTHAERLAALARRKLKRHEDVVRVERIEEPGEDQTRSSRQRT